MGDVLAQALSRSRRSTESSSVSSDEIQAFLQRRVAAFALLGTIVFGLLFAWRSASVLLGNLVHDRPVEGGSLGILFPVALFVGIWLICRGRPRSLRTLRALDAAGTLLACAAVLPMALRGPGSPGSPSPVEDYALIRPDYIVILVATYVLISRSIAVPSTARRTLVLGLVAAPVLLVGLFILHWRGHAPSDYSLVAGPELRMDPTAWALQWTAAGAVWWAAGVTIATVTSRVIYDLREEARDARKLGQYTLLEKLGEGGMGVVYRARHALLRRPTAVKLLRADKVGEASVARFEREVQLTAMLGHPNTVRVFDYGRSADGVFYYAMELLEGATLDQVVRASGPMPPGRVVHILRQIAGALAEAHGTGLIHRDIKPANIMLTELGGVPDLVKVLDFGLVKDVAGATSEGVTLEALSGADHMAGTPHYMSPEAITTPDRLDARTDIYALGAVGYYLLTAGEVFKGRTSLEVMSHHLHTEPLPPSQRVGRSPSQPVPADLERLLLRCLAKSPGARPASADEILALLERCGDTGRWSTADARAWWSSNREALATRAVQAAAPTTPAIHRIRREASTVRTPRSQPAGVVIAEAG